MLLSIHGRSDPWLGSALAADLRRRTEMGNTDSANDATNVRAGAEITQIHATRVAADLPGCASRGADQAPAVGRTTTRGGAGIPHAAAGHRRRDGLQLPWHGDLRRVQSRGCRADRHRWIIALIAAGHHATHRHRQCQSHDGSRDRHCVAHGLPPCASLAWRGFPEQARIRKICLSSTARAHSPTHHRVIARCDREPC